MQDGNISTPWGHSDYSEHIADGVTFYGTPSHGGLRVDARCTHYLAARRIANASQFSFVTRDGCVWLEEDCDAPRFVNECHITQH